MTDDIQENKVAAPDSVPLSATTTPEYKEKIKKDFIDDFWKGLTNRQLGDKYFGGVTYPAKWFIDCLRRSDDLPKGMRPTPGSTDSVDTRAVFERANAESAAEGAMGSVFKEMNLHKRRAVNEKDKTNALVQLIREELVPREAIPVPEVKVIGTQQQRVFKLLLSDLHAGQLITRSDSSGMEEYNINVFHARIDRLIREFDWRLKMTRSTCSVNVVDVSLLGDNAEGENIYPAQGHYSDLPTSQQLRHLRIGLGKLFLYLSSEFPTVRIRFVDGNHARVGQKGHNHKKTNWDHFLAELLRAEYSNQPNLEFYISDSAEMLYEIPELPGIHWLDLHGEHCQRISLKRAKSDYATLFNVPIHYMVTGHYHCSMKDDTPYGGVLVNGSFPGTNNHSKDHLRTGGIAKQVLAVMNPETGLETLHDLILQDKPRQSPKMDQKGVFTPLVPDSIRKPYS